MIRVMYFVVYFDFRGELSTGTTPVCHSCPFVVQSKGVHHFQIRIDVGRFLVNLAANIARNLAIDVDLVASVLRCCFEDGAR